MPENYKDYRSKLLEDKAYALEAAKGDFIMDVTEEILGALEKEKITKKRLAEKMNKTKGFISQLLNGSRNMTLSTLAEISFYLGYVLTIKFEKKSDAKQRIKLEMDLEPDECDYETKVA